MNIEGINEPPPRHHSCTACGHKFFDNNPPSCRCDRCPAIECEDCHEPDDRTCSCWVSVEDIPFADLKGLFADMGINTGADGRLTSGREEGA